MYKKNLKKISYNFLKNDYPENLIPKEKWTKKQKKIVSSRKAKISLKKRIKKAENFLLNKNTSTILKKKVYYLYSLQQIKYELYRKGKQDKNSSHFLHMLKEKKKLSLLYGGISNLFFQKIYNETLKIQGKFTQNLLIFLEKRLDVILYRICFCKSIAAARQAINHNLILVNGKVVNISSYIVKVGDVITINRKHSNFFKKTIYNTIQNSIYKRRSRLVLPQGLLGNFLKSVQKDKKNILYSLQRNTKNNNQLDYYNILSQIENFFLYKGIKKFSYTEKQKYKYCLYKQYLSKYRSRRHKLTAMQISAMKPLNIEVSYRILTAVILFSPQKLFFPALIDLDLIKRFFD